MALKNMRKNLNKSHDYIIVLCPEVNPEDKGKFTNFKHGLYLGGGIRMEAAYKLYQKNKKVILILVADYNKDNVSGDDTYKLSYRTDSMRAYLLNCGVPNKNLRIVNSLPCTRHNLVAVFNNFSDAFKNKKIGLLTNSYHLPRSLSFWIELKKYQKYYNVPSLPDPIFAEDIIDNNIRYKKSGLYIARLELEARGVIDVILDNYKDGCIGLSSKGNKLAIRSDYKRIVEENKERLLTPDEIKLV